MCDTREPGQGRGRLSSTAGLALSPVVLMMKMKEINSIIFEAFSASISSNHGYPTPCQGPCSLTLSPGFPVLQPYAADLPTRNPSLKLSMPAPHPRFCCAAEILQQPEIQQTHHIIKEGTGNPLYKILQLKRRQIA